MSSETYSEREQIETLSYESVLGSAVIRLLI